MNIFVSIYWKVSIVWLAARWIPQVNVGDEIVYKGGRYFVLDGSSPESWKLSGAGRLPDQLVDRRLVKKVWSIKNMLRSYNSGYKFYRSCWYEIWVKEGIKPWMRRLSIWPQWPGFRK